VKRYPPTRLVLVAVLAFVLGWLASTVWLGFEPLRYEGTLEGTVALVNEDGSKLCLEPDRGGDQRCGVLAGPPEALTPVVGDHVTIVVGWLRRSESLEQQIFLITGGTVP